MTKTRSTRQRKPRTRTPTDIPRGYYPRISREEIIAQAQIPRFDSLVVHQQVFRFRLNNTVTTAINFNTAACLGLYCVARGTIAPPLSIFGNMRIKWIKLWQPCAVAEAGSVPEADILLEFASTGVAGGLGGAPKITHTASVATSAKYAYLKAVPNKNEAAAQWFSSGQPGYNLWNMSTGTDCIMDICFDYTFVNGETPLIIVPNCSLPAGTVGVTNFANASSAPAGCRSVGLVDLISP